MQSPKCARVVGNSATRRRSRLRYPTQNIRIDFFEPDQAMQNVVLSNLLLQSVLIMTSGNYDMSQLINYDSDVRVTIS